MSIITSAQHTFYKVTTLKDWYRVLAPRQLKKRDSTVHLRNGLIFHLRNAPGDLTVLYGIFAHHVYDTVRGLRKSNPVIIDIGGHVGMFSVLAARLYPSARLYSYEPDPENAALLRENAKTNGVANRITLSEVAVSGEQGTMTLFTNPANSSENNMFKKKRGMVERTVPTTTLKDIFVEHNLERVDFAKIDCEGAEYNVLFNTPEDITNRIDRIALEWHGYAGHDPHELEEFLRARGFTTRFVNRPRMIYAERV